MENAAWVKEVNRRLGLIRPGTLSRTALMALLDFVTTAENVTEEERKLPEDHKLRRPKEDFIEETERRLALTKALFKPGEVRGLNKFIELARMVS